VKQYHTSIVINCSQETLWNELTNFKEYPKWNPIVRDLNGEMKAGSKIATFIVPLHKTYYPKLLAYTPYIELTWQGTQGAKWLMAGKHYYKLEKINDRQTTLLHGEYFTGIFSYLISKSLLDKMRFAFTYHNELLKERIEIGKK
jgi:hypothetical protein